MYLTAGQCRHLAGPGPGAVDHQIGQQPHALAADDVLQFGAADAAALQQQAHQAVAQPHLAAGCLQGVGDGMRGVKRIAGGVGHAEDAYQTRVEQRFLGQGRGRVELFGGDAGGLATGQEGRHVVGRVFFQRHKETARIFNGAGQQALEQ